MYVCVLHTVDRISLSESEFTVEEGSKEVLINITRTGKVVDDIIVKFVAREIPSACERAQRRGMCARINGITINSAHALSLLANKV